MKNNYMLFITLILVLYGIIAADFICEDKGVCGDDETCCLISPNVFGCCPYINATCCSDGNYCCPNDYICDLEEHSCSRGNRKRDMLEKHSAKRVLKIRKGDQIGNKLQVNVSLDLTSLGDVLCPDKCSTCPDYTTCCLLESGEYGCCPYQSAVCCSDYIHCCPQNYVCNLPSCVPSQRFQYKDFTKVATYVKNENVLNYLSIKTVTCPDMVSVCSEGSTCCEKPGGGYTCCPYPNADCCSDGVHCCPSGYHCSFETKGCVKENFVLPMLRKQKAKIIPQNIIKILNLEKETHVCPGGLYFCSSKEECCLIKQDVFGCCPQSQIVSCEDDAYYCPEHSKCDIKNFRCITSNGSFKNIMKKKLASIVKSALAERLNLPILCPDQIHSCDSASSCCLLKNGNYGCCAISNAVVCDDIHYCPLDYKCGKTGCYNAENSMTSFMKIGISKLTTICHDGATCCPNSYTCCLIGDNVYGCCPLPYATCCDDRVHCCPYGYICNGDGTCSNEAESLNALKLLKGFSKHGIEISKDSVRTNAIVNVKNVECPDLISQCPNDNTCCTLESGQYGCCPLPNAVCCADHEHCCPHGFSCISGGYCTQGNLRVKGLVRTKAVVNVKNVECPDGISQCPDNNTCCTLESGQYACCPLPNAVCCADHEHCCPHGFSCVGGGYCTQGILRIKGLVHTKAIVKLKNVECPDGISQCPDGNTCCTLESGQYGCCPLPNAVCCADHEHCCQEGYSCDAGGYCTRGNLKVKGLVRTKAIVNVKNVECPDGISQCPDNNTCCTLESGQYACCPLPNAVCCADHEHCCPHGFSCIGGGYCTQGSLRIKGLVHTKAIVKMKNVECPDGISQCPDGNTCCTLESGQYGCCPLPNAVCCADHEHCCQEGYSCDAGGYCTRGNLRVKGLVRTKAIVNVKNVECPDGISQCPDNNTCCTLESGQYACCPLPNAVCCADHEHCCPHGFSCFDGGYCTHGNVKIKGFIHAKANLKLKNIDCSDNNGLCISKEDQISTAKPAITFDDHAQVNANNPYSTTAKEDQLNEKKKDYVMF
ncbi:progranulin isoform X8 [Hydra vulgaris]|uniref:Progranulin isoform X8 n=1 Tax=Hydra vulgaris TaxID=6087 RepID=A0ABM4CT94_HYDVU